MKGVNKAIIVGNLGQEPETKHFPDGGCLTNISVATSEHWKDKRTGEKQERTEWHKIVFNGRLAEIASEFLKKGSKVYIEGKIQTRKWQDKEGNDRYSTEIRAFELQMLDSRSGSSNDSYSKPQESQNPNHEFGTTPQGDEIPF